MLLEETELANSVHGNARQVQPFGPSRRLHAVQMEWEAFKAPAIPRQETLSQERQKMILVERYAKARQDSLTLKQGIVQMMRMMFRCGSCSAYTCVTA